MTEAILSLIWAGGFMALSGPAGVWKALIWPAYLGRYLAKIALHDYFTEQETTP